VTSQTVGGREPRRGLSDRAFGFLLTLPALVLFVAIVLYPLIASLTTSLFTQSLVLPGRSFAGLENFRTVLAGQFWSVLQNTLVFTVACTLIPFVLGLFGSIGDDRKSEITNHKSQIMIGLRSSRRSDSGTGRLERVCRGEERAVGTFLGAMRGQCDRELRTSFGFVVGAYGSSVQLDEVANDGQAKTRAAGTRPRLIYSIEALEHTFQVGRRNSRTRVRDHDVDQAVATNGLDADVGPFRGVVDGVLDQVPQDVVQLGRVGLDHPSLRRNANRHVLLLGIDRL